MDDDDDQLVRVTTVSRLEVAAGETLVITAPLDTGGELAWVKMAEAIKRWHPDVHVLVLPSQSTISVVSG